MVADLRCETPSAAAEVLSSAQAELSESLERSGRRLVRNMEHAMRVGSERLHKGHPKRVLDVIWERVNDQQKKLARIDLVNRAYDYLGVYNFHQRLDDSIYRLKSGIERKYSKLEERNRNAYDLWRVLDPKNVLGRGYSIVKDQNDKVIPSLSDFEMLSENEKISLMFFDGRASVTLREKE